MFEERWLFSWLLKTEIIVILANFTNKKRKNGKIVYIWFQSSFFCLLFIDTKLIQVHFAFCQLYLYLHNNAAVFGDTGRAAVNMLPLRRFAVSSHACWVLRAACCVLRRQRHSGTAAQRRMQQQQRALSPLGHESRGLTAGSPTPPHSPAETNYWIMLISRRRCAAPGDGLAGRGGAGRRPGGVVRGGAGWVALFVTRCFHNTAPFVTAAARRPG